MNNPLPFEFDDGGRKAAGFVGNAGDCVTRSICIAGNLPYVEVYSHLSALCCNERQSKKRSARNGVHVKRQWFKDYMSKLGWKWISTMGIGTGCHVHLRKYELPMGKLILSVSKHMTAVIDGVIHDTHDPSRNGMRCVYGYWIKIQNS
jgi:hypothetical protein